MTEFNAFVNKPKKTSLVMSPMYLCGWNRMWDAAKAETWWEAGVTYVGSDSDFHYFQKRGLKTGYARVARQLNEGTKA